MSASPSDRVSRWRPTAAEASSVRFLLPLPSLRVRFLLAGAFFFVGIAAWALSPTLRFSALALILIGHLPLWVRRQTTSPGGATPDHEEIWAPTEEGWVARLEELEKQGKAWDASPLDLSSGRGCAFLFLLLALTTAFSLGFAFVFGADAAFRIGTAALFVLVPLWLNGIRTTWNPSELRLKGEALEVARQAAKRASKFDAVPLLALREGRRGKYPVDARLMLRPSDEDESGFLGIQVQVALNNVRGTDYPYLYCVVLGKGDFRLPDPRGPFQADKKKGRRALRLVYERGRDGEVQFLVVRQHADTGGGWHTSPEVIRELLEVAIEEGEAAWDRNRERAAQ